MLCCCETYVNHCIDFKLSFRIWLQLEVSILLSVLGFPFALNMEAGNLVKDKGFLCLLIIPCIFDEGRLVDKEIFCFLLNIPRKFSRQSEIFPVACVMRKIWDLNSL